MKPLGMGIRCLAAGARSHDQHHGTVAHRAAGGLDARKYPRPHCGRRQMSLDIPLYRTSGLATMRLEKETATSAERVSPSGASTQPPGAESRVLGLGGSVRSQLAFNTVHLSILTYLA